jgi:hypothetical protein
MVSLLSRQLLLPKPNNTFAAPAQLQPRPEPPQVLLDVSTAANCLDAAPNAFEKGMFRVFEPVIYPSAITVLFNEACRFHQL